ncbi:helix-turn-helix domain-containing protein [Streptomyces sp. NBC_00481]|uniref:helix-turn-helix domain-containing protein n=1 Tax=Streptomyces sp. NBC_00481 TaxID=2975755 RepID=UPI002DD8AD95|nr:helix-turn-helix domain-containing protein [Streptomyces sp. NBC_00481]WRY99051.1 helix-turn-helix domain-containing protein [Streptomyces sp. NBC_00481]
MSGYVGGALVDGVTAHVLDKVLASPNVAEVLCSLPPWMRAEVEAGRRAIRRAAREYEQLAVAAVEGSAETEVPDVGAPLGHEITTCEAAALLDVTERRVRQLAAGGMGQRRGGRWVLDRSAVLAYAERRRAA